MLEKEYEIIETNNGRDAVEIVKKQNVDIILMDINLKHGLTGIQATKLIREIKGYENVPIVAITAYAMSSDRVEFLKSGFSHYLAKPFSKNDIIQLLMEIRKYL
jgi:CheY-like chemotaxis protein